MARKSLSLDLPPAADLFSTQAERDDAILEKVVQLPPELIDEFPSHPFKVRQDADMAALADSIKEHGILMPLLVRPKEGGRFEMVAGHRRQYAASQIGLSVLPCLVRNLTDDEATILMVDSNLQREKILPSERAFAYKMKLDATKRQGQRTDLTSCPVGTKSRSDEQLAQDAPDSARQIQRYIRLTCLLPDILQMVDDGKIALRPAVELSYLKPNEQKAIFEEMKLDDCTPSLAQAIRLKSFSKEGKLDAGAVAAIMTEEKPNQREQLKIPKEQINRYFPRGTPEKQIQDTILRALDFYRQHQKDMIPMNPGHDAPEI